MTEPLQTNQGHPALTMIRRGALKRPLTWLMSLALGALLLAGALPHHHGKKASAASDHTHACRICQIHQSLSATPPCLTFQPTPALVEIGAPPLQRAPYLTVLLATSAPRAPPVLS